VRPREKRQGSLSPSSCVSRSTSRILLIDILILAKPRPRIDAEIARLKSKVGEITTVQALGPRIAEPQSLVV
jgi:hypothetical protein